MSLTRVRVGQGQRDPYLHLRTESHQAPGFAKKSIASGTYHARWSLARHPLEKVVSVLTGKLSLGNSPQKQTATCSSDSAS